MEHPRKRPEYVLEVLADPTYVKDIVRGTALSLNLRQSPSR